MFPSILKPGQLVRQAVPWPLKSTLKVHSSTVVLNNIIFDIDTIKDGFILMGSYSGFGGGTVN